MVREGPTGVTSAPHARDLRRKRNGAARRPPRSNLLGARLLPGAGRAAARALAAAVAGSVAGASGSATGVLLNLEVSTRLRSSDDGVLGGTGRPGADLALGGRGRGRSVDVEAGRVATDVASSRRQALLVILGVRVARLDLRREVACIRLGIRVVALLLLAKEGRQGDGGEDADD